MSVFRCERGQATIEFAVVFPVLIIVAVIAVNAMVFFSECAAFDRMFRQETRAIAASPAYSQGAMQSTAKIRSALATQFDGAYESVSVSAQTLRTGTVRFEGELSYSPNLFGRGMVDEVFGVSLPKLRHKAFLVVDTYRPGVLF